MSAERIETLDTVFCCSDCNKCFNSASNLLTHFAFHASQLNNYENEKKTAKNNGIFLHKSEKKCVPDLYPINVIKTKGDKTDNMSTNIVDLTISSKYLDTVIDQKDNLCGVNNILFSESNNSNVKIEFDNDFNPLKYCSISMEIKDQTNSVLLSNERKYEKNITISEGTTTTTTKKKYPCSFCAKIFGWSTDLKRHVLVHTGERPFKCKLCNASFTRNFLLQKHENKIHQKNVESKLDFKNNSIMPNLKPIHSNVVNVIKVKDPRKQDKQKIKRKFFYGSNIKKNEEFCGLLRSQLNFIDKVTKVQ